MVATFQGSDDVAYSANIPVQRSHIANFDIWQPRSLGRGCLRYEEGIAVAVFQVLQRRGVLLKFGCRYSSVHGRIASIS